MPTDVNIIPTDGYTELDSRLSTVEDKVQTLVRGGAVIWDADNVPTDVNTIPTDGYADLVHRLSTVEDKVNTEASRTGSADTLPTGVDKNSEEENTELVGQGKRKKMFCWKDRGMGMLALGFLWALNLFESR